MFVIFGNFGMLAMPQAYVKRSEEVDFNSFS